MGRQPVGMLVVVAAMGLAGAGWLRADDRSAPDRHLFKIDLDANSSVPGEPAVSSEALDPEFGLQPNCERIGAFGDDFAGASRFRGNAFSIVGGEAIVQEIKMELQYFGTTTLSFSIHERSLDGNTFTRKFVRTLEAVEGMGSPAFFSSGPIVGGFSLSQGRDYAIGVSWGPGVNVTYARNIQAQPTAFAGGQVLGLVGANNVTPPLDEQVNLFITTTGAYSMELCIKPAPGACCHETSPENFGCQLLLEAECVEVGSFFHGQRTSCADSPCMFGACCSPCAADGCLPDFTLQACDAVDGFHHTRRTCADVGAQCEEKTGACCLGGVCADLCEAECIAQLGVYRGDDTECDPVFNPCRGACCIDDFGCINRSEQACLEFNLGRYRGDATTCATLSPELQCLGACCFKQGGVDECVDGGNASTREDCAPGEDVDEAIYIGDALSCPMTQALNCPDLAEPNSVASCCLPNGACLNTDETDCLSSSGLWNSTGDCSAAETCQGEECCFLCPITPVLECPLLDGAPEENNACCLPTGACTNTNETECVKLAGEWNPDPLVNCETAGQTCVVGACCFDDGACTVLTMTGCEGTVIVVDDQDEFVGFGGHWAGMDTTCSVLTCDGVESIPTGACCEADGTCVVRRESRCDVLDGLYRGDTTTCEPNECIPFRGCCREDGVCFDRKTNEQCNGLGGRWGEEVESTCATAECDRRGACCTSTGRCLQINQIDCIGLAGADFFSGADCSEATCGACCRANGTCDATLKGKCPAPGEFTEATDCDDLDSECSVLIVCCTGGEFQCSELRVRECDDAGGQTQGPVVPGSFGCSIDACRKGSCCVAGACADTDAFSFERSCEAFAPDAVFVSGALCGLDEPCAVTAACCLNGVCQDDSTTTDCTAQGGTFQGADSVCGAESCGGCCGDEGCRDALPSLCVGANGAFFAGTTCVEDEPCVPKGACCVSGVCEPSRSESQCASAGGSYLGDDTTCVGGPCLLGACCRADVVCQNGEVANECAGPGETFSTGFMCNQVACQPRGACCSSGSCTLQTAAGCTAIGGDYAGDLIECVEDSCVPTACCHLPGELGVCANLSPVVCLSLSGFSVTGLPCETAGLRCDLGSCCSIDGVCENDMFQAACVAPGQFSIDACSAVERNCEARGACCVPGQDVCRVVSQTGCTIDLGGFYAGDEIDCVDDFCAVGACCLDDGSCRAETRQACDLFGHYTTAGMICGGAACCPFDVVSSVPENCTVDAGMPGDGGGTVDRPPWNSVVIQYGCPLERIPAYTARVEPVGVAPTVQKVAMNIAGTAVTVTLSDPIEPGVWTCLIQLDTDAEWCFGSLPGDVNGNLVADTDDLTRLVGSLNGGDALQIYSCDTDRTDDCAAPDLIEVIDLLNGGWNGQTLPVCPTAP